MNWFYRLNDTTDTWLSTDKISHVGWGAFAFCLGGWWLLALASLAVETIEVIRWRAWVAKGKPVPRPMFCDLASFRDLIANVLGGVLAVILSWVFRFIGVLG